MATVSRAMHVARCDHPADEGQQGGDMDHRRVKPRGAIGDAPIGRASGLGRFHHARHLGQEGFAGGCRGLDRREVLSG